MRKNNRFISFIMALFVGISCLFTVACGKAKFSVKFMVDDIVYATVSTKGEELIHMPDDPIKEDYIFEGWYWDKDVWKNEFTATSLLKTPLSSTMQVYAHFIDESYLKGTEINIKNSEKKNLTGVGDVFYLPVRNKQTVCKFNDYVEINPRSTYVLSTDLAGTNVIPSKTIELQEGDSPLYYIHVKDKDGNSETYIVLVHRNLMYTVYFETFSDDWSCKPQSVEEGYYLEYIPTPSRNGYEFEGWSYDFKNRPITSNVRAEAKWKANKYKIILDPNGGTVLTTELDVYYDDFYTLPVIHRKGYTLKGWQTWDGSYFSDSGFYNYDENVYLTAQWEINYYSLYYDFKGGTSAGEVYKSSYTVNDSFILPHPIREGYTFRGWDTRDFSENPKLDYEVKAGTTGSLKFYASWVANTYTITYDVNGGDNFENNEQNVTYGEQTELKTPTRTGYEFAGWYNNGDKFEDGVWNNTSDVTLTAKWKAKEYKIFYNLNGGSNHANNPFKFTPDSETIVLNNPTKRGYIFKGWTSIEQATPVIGLTIPKGSTGDKTFEANWEASKVIVNFDVNGGNELENNVHEYEFDSNVVLPVPSRPGYHFSGWYNGSKLVANGIWKIDENITLIARWSLKDFNIQYELNGGTNSYNNPRSYSYESETIVLENPTKLGYTFIGWTTEGLEEPVIGIEVPKNSTGDKLFIANWKANTYTITYDVNSGNPLDSNTEEVIFNEAIYLPTPTKHGYTFNGWYLNGSFFESGVYKQAKDITLVAEWTANTYKITTEDGQETSVTYDENFRIPPNSKKGFEFEGWFSDLYGQGKQFTDKYGFSLAPYDEANDVTLYAGFTYNITFVSNGGSYVPTLKLKENECLSEAIVSEKEGLTFGGWYFDEELTKPVSNDKPINGSTTIYAKWLEEATPSQLIYEQYFDEIRITDSNFEDEKLIIPSHIGGLSVTQISYSSFLDNSTITELVVPNTVTRIENEAFKGLSSLRDITLPFIGREQDYTGRQSVFGHIFGIDDKYSSPNSIKQTYLNDSYQTLEHKNYYIPTTIRNVTITKQKDIPLGAFSGCYFIEHIKIPENVDSIGAYAFYDCNNLLSLNSKEDGDFKLPTKVSRIEDYTFYNCGNISKFNSDTPFTMNINNKINHIGDYAFRNTKLIKTLNVHEKVVFIGYSAFKGLSSLVDVTLPFVGRSMKETGETAVFGHIFGRSDAPNMLATNQVINKEGDYLAFDIPFSIQNVTITTQTAIPLGAFSDCRYIKHITIPEDVHSIGMYAFYRCCELLTLNSEVEGSFRIPVKVKSLEDYSFYGCEKLAQFNSDEPFTININIGIIGKCIFGKNDNIETLIVDNDWLTTSIEIGAFQGLDSLKNVTLPFVGAGNNGEFALSVGASFGTIFGSVPDNDENYQDSGILQYGWRENPDRYKYYYIPTTIRNVTITKQKEIPVGAFSGCYFIEHIKIPENVGSIGEGAFYNCNNLLNLNSDDIGVFKIPSTVRDIHAFTFSHCNNLQIVIISEYIDNIYNFSFDGCSKLKRFNSNQDGTIIIPFKCLQIGDYAFRGASLIHTLEVQGNVRNIGRGAFRGLSSLVNVTLPFAGESNYGLGVKGVFGYIFDYTEDPTELGVTHQSTLDSGNKTFYFYIPESIRNVTITVSEYIPQFAFENCHFIANINLLEFSVEEPNAFENCYATVRKVLKPFSYLPWGGEISTSFSGGDGTINNPYIISSGADLAYLAQEVNNGNSFKGVYFVLGGDINLDNGELNIGKTQATPFSGIINGKGHTIRNVKYGAVNDWSETIYIGLFGYFDGELYNVGFENIQCYWTTFGSKTYAGLIGYASENSYIHNIYVEGSVHVGAKELVYAGGIAGTCLGKISNVFTDCRIYIESTNYIVCAGGIVGYLNNGIIENSFALNGVTAKGVSFNYSRNGGIVGENNKGAVRNCFRQLYQYLYRYDKNGSYNDEGTVTDFRVMTVLEIIEFLEWDQLVWEDDNWIWPTLKN